MVSKKSGDFDCFLLEIFYQGKFIKTHLMRIGINPINNVK